MQKRKFDKDGIYRRQDSPYWWASYTDASSHRTRRSTGTTDRKEAEALLAKWRLEAHRAEKWDEQPNRTFDELMLGYLQETQNQKRSAHNDQLLAKRLYPAFTGKVLTMLTATDVHQYTAERRRQGVSDSTIRRELALLSSAISYAVKWWDWQVPNPVTGRKPAQGEGRVRWLSRVEAMALISAAEAEPKAPHLANFIRLALNTGMRRGEMLGLEWRRVDLQNRLIRLDAEHTKTAKRRTVPLNENARAAILGQLRFRSAHCPDSPWAFCNINGQRITTIKRSFATACRRAGIQDFRIHDLRHTCAAWLVTAGVALPEVRDLLGHSTIQMTERYAHLAMSN